ncbi:hypothetical protein JTB14_010487 [Gonioctena quinquepunctata]|nr:hypothetical protein JTB14_010487 [Gonioctena quinquepunctata]
MATRPRKSDHHFDYCNSIVKEYPDPKVITYPREESLDIVCLQELHVGDINQLNYRVQIESFKIATYILSNTHGYAILVKSNIMDSSAEPIASAVAGLEILKLELPSVNVISVYKSPFPQYLIQLSI